MKKKDKPAKPTTMELLDSIGFVETNSPLVKGLRLTGANGRQCTFGVGPQGLEEVLIELNSLQVMWAEYPEAVRATESGPRKALPATRITLEPGREPTEVALTIHAGPMQFLYLLPVQGVVPPMLAMLKTIGQLEEPKLQ